MNTVTERLARLGVSIPQILLPEGNLEKWGIVACDQYTSQPAYWEALYEQVGDAASTLHIVYPEVYLDRGDKPARIARIHQTMARYAQQVLTRKAEGMVYTKREVDGLLRRGLMLAIDLEHYDYHVGSKTLVRATEGTIIERIPPRVAIRQDACIECPHILLLIDDPQRLVIEPLDGICHEPLYYTPLLAGGGQVSGWRVPPPALEGIAQGLEALFAKASAPGGGGLLFAVGDGNHSLATAKACWQQLKQAGANMDHPARWALVEVNNVHDEGLVFEPIHRLVTGAPALVPALEAAADALGWHLRWQACAADAAKADLDGPPQAVGVVSQGRWQRLTLEGADEPLTVGSLQRLLDAALNRLPDAGIDYIHGGEALTALAQAPGCYGFYLPVMSKSALFPAVVAGGSLPRKTFSMGQANQKRYYMECRRIR